MSIETAAVRYGYWMSVFGEGEGWSGEGEGRGVVGRRGAGEEGGGGGQGGQGGAGGRRTGGRSATVEQRGGETEAWGDGWRIGRARGGVGNYINIRNVRK